MNDNKLNPVMESKERKLSVVFSFRNEEDVLTELVSRMRNVLSEEQKKGVLTDYELIFVNDASTDRSKELLEGFAQEKNDIKIITMSRTFGVSPCVLAGMRYSTGDAVIYMDADLQDPPEVVSQMLEAWQSEGEIDVVHTVRKSRSGESAFKLFLTKIGYKILSYVSNIDLLIDAGDFKLLSRRAVNSLIQLKEKDPFMRGLVTWIGFKQISITYHRQSRFRGETKFPVLSRKVIGNFLKSALISFSALPLQLSSFLGLFGFFISFLMMIHVLSEKLDGNSLPGWTAIMSAILFIGSIQLLTIGIIGLYLHSIYLGVKDRPNYIIKSKYGFEKDD